VILNEVKKQDLNKVTLEVRVENKKAQALYRHLGFRDNFIRRNYYTNVDRPDSDGLNMICDLRKKNKCQW
ncbi:MAG: ribosomal-protein-alanine N-acetyltransferase, partial [Lactobacillus sp.]